MSHKSKDARPPQSPSLDGRSAKRKHPGTGAHDTPEKTLVAMRRAFIAGNLPLTDVAPKFGVLYSAAVNLARMGWRPGETTGSGPGAYYRRRLDWWGEQSARRQPAIERMPASIEPRGAQVIRLADYRNTGGRS